MKALFHLLTCCSAAVLVSSTLLATAGQESAAPSAGQYQEQDPLLNFVPVERRDDIEDEIEEKVEFLLKTRANRDVAEHLTIPEPPEVLQYFDPARPTKILVHGWHSSPTTHFNDVAMALLDVMDVNVFLLNWRTVDTILYPLAVARVPLVARRLAALVDYLAVSFGVQPGDLHVVGHSLGAHIAGMSGEFVTAGRIGRITGLDPAGPLFTHAKKRLSKEQAAFVDVIHTCANVFGLREPLGHADFYPNGGKCFQPGCALKDLTTGKCSHNRAYDLFIESISRADAFVAQASRPYDRWPCTKTDEQGEKQVMGLATPESARGVFCLTTRASPPYGLGDQPQIGGLSSEPEKALLVHRLPNRLETSIMLSNFLGRARD